MSVHASTRSAEMSTINLSRRPAWRERLVMLERGVMLSFRGSSIVAIHFFCALIGSTAGLVLGLGALQWSILVLCFSTTLAAELSHQAVKKLCRSSSLGRADARCAEQLSAAAATLALCGAILVALIVLLSRVAEFW
ncbi:Prokaryotic diacylglycerol kinase [Caulifigura coniformis]|uniref:Prokaryotic diacylglycerol kinase n=2 Tax=Caulifigura coniformis TaxID=2527983 RepID=A0A517SDW8_9PLAN|nr:Prokaryotic diacylglycerol kinase [Caulifigura coniformis]